MLVEEWDDWAAKHAMIFGLTSPGDAAMFGAWREVFARAGYTSEELNEATDYIAVNNPPRYRNEHLGAINRRVTERRRVMRLHNQEQAEREGIEAHGLCDGTGRVLVPHLSCVIDGEWLYPWYTVCVLCSCHKGERIRLSLENSAKPDGEVRKVMGIEQYTLVNSDWRRQMDNHKQQKKAELTARTLGDLADKKAPIDPKLAELAKDRPTRKAAATPLGKSVDEVLRKNKE